jgi:hypothetical protein
MVTRPESEPGTIGLATTDWPIVLIEFPERRVPDSGLLATLDEIESLLKKAKRNREKLFFITDLTLMREITPANQRKLTAEWIKRTAPLSTAASVGGATVTPSAILRGIITALYWVHPSPTPSYCVTTRHEGMLKGIDMLEEVKALLSPRLIAYRDKHGTGSAGVAGQG